MRNSSCSAKATPPQLTSPQFVQAIQSGVHGAVALCFIEWAGPGQQALVARWMVIRDGEGATDFAKMLLAAPRSFAGRTAIGDGIDFASAQLAAGEHRRHAPRDRCVGRRHQ